MPSLLTKFIGQIVEKSSWDSVFLKNLDVRLFGQDVEREPYRKSELVYICISATARAIGQVPLKVMQFSKEVSREAMWKIKMASHTMGLLEFNKFVDKQTEELEAVDPENPYQLLFERPNPYLNGQLFKEALIGFILLDGNVWILPLPVKDFIKGTNDPFSLWIINKRNIKPKTDMRTGQLEYWNYSPQAVTTEIGGGIPVSPNEIMQVKLWNPYDNIMGLSPLDPGAIPIRTSYKSSAYNEKFFDQGAVPEGVLSTVQRLGKTQFERTAQQFEEKHRGQRKLAVLEQGLKYEATGLSQKDMQFINLRKYDRETIMQIFGMKKAIISVTDDLNYATAREQRKEWWQDNNIPIMKLIASALNFGMFWNTPYIVRWDTSGIESLHEEYSGKVDTAYKLYSMGFTASELNEKLELGFKHAPWRDVAYYPANLIPMPPEGPDVSGELPPANTPLELPVPADEETEDLNEEPHFPVSKEFELQSAPKWQKAISKQVPIEKEFDRVLRKIFFEMRKKSLKDVYKGSKDIHTAEVDEFGNLKLKLQKDVKPLYKKAVNVGAATLATEIALADWNMEYPEALEYIANKSLRITGVIDTVKNRIRAQIETAIEEGKTIDETADMIRDVFNTIPSRAIKIARTETIGAMNYGRNELMKESGFENKQWFTALDERVRPAHVHAHGQVVSMDDSFEVGGEELQYPGDDNGSPENIIQCRCISIPTDEKVSK